MDDRATAGKVSGVSRPLSGIWKFIGTDGHEVKYDVEEPLFEVTTPECKTVVGPWKTCPGFDNREGVPVGSNGGGFDKKSWDAMS